MRRLINVVRSYPWGSRTAIASLQRRAVPSARPEAELWLGAHPSAPSMLCDQGVSAPLPEIIAQDPEVALGPAVAGRFGPRLPYLLKVLAAEEPLSLQAHPDAEQARIGFAAEAALPPGAAARNYVDPYHKPELLVAVEPFEALCGFRDPAESADLLSSFGVPALASVVEALRTGSADQRLQEATRSLMTWPLDDRARLVGEVTAAGERRSGHGRAASQASVAVSASAAARAHALAARLGRRYPGDIAVVIALLLNHVQLRPDQAIFMPAGNLHAYLRGLAVEVMAASDNVLRGGLTRKRVDLGELGRVVRYDVLAHPVIAPVALAEGVLSWPVPVAEFALVKAIASAAPRALPGDGPRIVLCLRGQVRLSTGDESRVLGAGEAVFVTAAEPPVQLSQLDLPAPTEALGLTEPLGPTEPLGTAEPLEVEPKRAIVFQVSAGDENPTAGPKSD